MSKRENVVRLYGSLIWLCLQLNCASADIIKYDKSIIEDAQLHTHQLIRKYGYPVEVHKIQTKDGFVLTAHRIPKPGGQPVLLVHGLEDSSAAYILLGPTKSLGYLLSDKGYDVWLLNTRGNRYSRKHLRYHRLQPQFWDFSFHEVGSYDLPASIDYILARSKGFRQVHYVGHSQGTTSFFVLGSERPKYMKKIKLMQALAPVAYFDYTEGPAVVVLSRYVRHIASLARIIGIHEWPPENEVWRRLLYQVCSFAFSNTCAYFALQLSGVDVEQFNQTLAPLFLGHFPSGSSVKSMEHYGQLVRSGGFFKYNYYNPYENRRRHGSAKLPQYNLTNVNCKVALYYGSNDLLTAVKDVQRLRQKLTNVVHDQLMANKKFNHLDFTWGSDVKRMLNDDMLEVMRRVDQGEL